MLDVKVNSKVESRCGICCNSCEYLLNNICSGKCINIDKPFWGDRCEVKSCCENKKLECCGECDLFPCDLLKKFAYDEQQGDGGLRIETCKEWCSK